MASRADACAIRCHHHAVFVQTIVRARGPSVADAAVAAQRFLASVADPNNIFDLLLVCSYTANVHTVLVDETDWRKREREARWLRREVATREAMILYAKKIRFHELFLLLGVGRSSRHERAIRGKLLDEYLANVSSPWQEEVFFRATEGIVREILTPWLAEDAPDHFERRARKAKLFVEHSTDRTFPFMVPDGLDLYDSQLFDLGGEGDETYVVASVHV